MSFTLNPSIRFFIIFLIFSTGSIAWADSIKRFELKHRDAIEVKNIIAPLLNQDGAITVDNNSLIIKTSASSIKQLTSIIKRMDAPQKKLKIAVYRGKYPKDHSVDQQGVITYTTNTGVNDLQFITTEQGRTVSITQNNIVKINTVDESYYEHTIGLSKNDRDNLKQIHTDPQAVIAGNKTHSQIIALPVGTYLRTSLVGKKEVRIDLKSITPVDDLYNQPKPQKNQLLNLSNETDTVITALLDQWIEVSQYIQFSHRPVLGSNRKVYSTETKKDKQLSVWVKVSLLK